MVKVIFIRLDKFGVEKVKVTRFTRRKNANWKGGNFFFSNHFQLRFPPTLCLFIPLASKPIVDTSKVQSVQFSYISSASAKARLIASSLKRSTHLTQDSCLLIRHRVFCYFKTKASALQNLHASSKNSSTCNAVCNCLLQWCISSSGAPAGKAAKPHECDRDTTSSSHAAILEMFWTMPQHIMTWVFPPID
jgi:hypothetical protein